MKRAILMAVSAFALMASAAVASAEELSVSISEVNGSILNTPITFDFNTAAPYANGTGSVLYVIKNASVSDIYNIYFYDVGSGAGQSPFGGFGVGGANGFFTLSFLNQFTSGVTAGGQAILDDPFPLGATIVDDASQRTVLTFAQVPEPAAWTLMLAGFGAIGASLRSRRRIAAAV